MNDEKKVLECSTDDNQTDYKDEIVNSEQTIVDDYVANDENIVNDSISNESLQDTCVEAIPLEIYNELKDELSIKKLENEMLKRENDELKKMLMDSNNNFSSIKEILNNIAIKQDKNNQDLNLVLKDSNNFKEGVRSRLQKEVEMLKEDKNKTLFNPLFKQLGNILCEYYFILSLEMDLKIKNNIEQLFEQIEEWMEEYNVFIKRTKPGEKCEVKYSKVIEKNLTKNIELHSIVEKSIRPGIIKGDLLLCPEYVSIYFYDEKFNNLENVEINQEINEQEKEKIIEE